MVLEHDDVKPVVEIGLGRARQLHLENILRDRRLPLEHHLHGRRLRRLLLRYLRRRANRGSCERDAGEGQGRAMRGVHGRTPFGVVTTTVRLAGVKYLEATRCTSAAGTFAMRSGAVAKRPGSLEQIALCQQ